MDNITVSVDLQCVKLLSYLNFQVIGLKYLKKKKCRVDVIAGQLHHDMMSVGTRKVRHSDKSRSGQHSMTLAMSSPFSHTSTCILLPALFLNCEQCFTTTDMLLLAQPLRHG